MEANTARSPHEDEHDENVEEDSVADSIVDVDADADHEVEHDAEGGDELGDSKPRKKRRVIKTSDKKFNCPTADCGKSYSRAEHLYRHQLNRMYRIPRPKIV